MLNKATIIGNLGADPDVRYTPTGKQITSFSVATTDKWRDQQGEMQESTEWHRIITWGRLAEICAEYLLKGSRVYIEGKIQTRKWTDNNNVDRYTTEIIAREMKMLSAKNSSGSASGSRHVPDPDSPLDEQPPIPYSEGDDVPF